MKILAIITSSIFLVSGCISLDIGNVVSDTVDAGKELYQTLKRKSNGEEERKYSHSVPSPDENSDLLSSAKCTQYIRNIIKNSDFNIVEIVSESSKLSVGSDARSIQCTLIAVVKKLTV